MSLVPSSNLGSIMFYEGVLPLWETNYAEIGLLVGDVGAATTLVEAARAAYVAQQAALDAAKLATQNANAAVAAMKGIGAINILKIRTYADSTNNINVYTLAGLPFPAVPSAMPAPGLCTNLSVTILPTGALTLKWKCVNPTGATGTSYEVARRIGGSGAFTIIGSGGGNKTFIDDTLPIGSGPVFYRITGVRSTVRGTTNEFVVNFGVGGGGGGFTVQSVNEVTPVQLAA